MPINNKSGTQPGLCSSDSVGSQGSGLCVANLHVDSNTACLVPDLQQKRTVEMLLWPQLEN